MAARLTIFRFVEILPKGTRIVTGGARGVDTFVEEAARAYGVSCTVLRPDYRRYPGAVAPLLRNTDIVQMVSELAVLWDGESRGTLDAIRKAQTLGKYIHYLGVRPREDTH